MLRGFPGYALNSYMLDYAVQMSNRQGSAVLCEKNVCCVEYLGLRSVGNGCDVTW
jgi:hypothetical protein